MNNELPPSGDPGLSRKPVPKIIWLLLALAPAALIMLIMGDFIAHEGGSGAVMFVAFGLNPVLSIFACHRLLVGPGQSKVSTIVGAIFLGAFFAALNLALGFLGGCAFSGKNFI